MSFKLPKVYPITDTTVSGLSHAEQVARLIEGGATLIQLRDKNSAPGIFAREAEAALRVARMNRVLLIINDLVDVALALGADGVHLGQTDMPADTARRVLKPGSIIGVSTHDLAQAEAAARLPVDYVAFGPVFETQTKADPEPVAGLERLRSARAAIGDLPLVAIGGITTANCCLAFEAGANSVATIGALLSDPTKITENMKRMLKLTEK